MPARYSGVRAQKTSMPGSSVGFDFFDHAISGRKEARLRSQSEARVQRLEAIVGGPGIQRGVDELLEARSRDAARSSATAALF